MELVDALVWHLEWQVAQPDKRIRMEEQHGRRTRDYARGHARLGQVHAPLQFHGTATTVGIFDMNGHYVGKNVNALPQGRYIVRQRVQGHTESSLYIKR